MKYLLSLILILTQFIIILNFLMQNFLNYLSILDVFAFNPLLSYKSSYKYSSSLGMLFTTGFFVFAFIISYYVS